MEEALGLSFDRLLMKMSCVIMRFPKTRIEFLLTLRASVSLIPRRSSVTFSSSLITRICLQKCSLGTVLWVVCVCVRARVRARACCRRGTIDLAAPDLHQPSANTRLCGTDRCKPRQVNQAVHRDLYPVLLFVP